MNTIVENAWALAKEAHEGQKRRYTNEEYFTHCEAVALRVSQAGCDEETIAGALLHDTLEDTTLDPERIRKYCGSRVLSMVKLMTDCKLDVGNRAARKRIDRQRLASGDMAVHTIKCSDGLDNLASILEHDKPIAVLYVQELKLTHEVLRLAKPDIWLEFGQALAAGQRVLEEAQLDANLQPKWVTP